MAERMETHRNQILKIKASDVCSRTPVLARAVGHQKHLATAVVSGRKRKRVALPQSVAANPGSSDNAAVSSRGLRR